MCPSKHQTASNRVLTLSFKTASTTIKQSLTEFFFYILDDRELKFCKADFIDPPEEATPIPAEPPRPPRPPGGAGVWAPRPLTSWPPPLWWPWMEPPWSPEEVPPRPEDPETLPEDVSIPLSVQIVCKGTFRMYLVLFSITIGPWTVLLSAY